MRVAITMEHACPCPCIRALPFDPEVCQSVHNVTDRWHTLTPAELHKHPLGLVSFGWLGLTCQFLCTTTQTSQTVSHGTELWLMITKSLWQWLPFLYHSYKFHQASLPKPMHAKCSTYLIFLDLITQPIFLEQYIVFCTALFPHPP